MNWRRWGTQGIELGLPCLLGTVMALGQAPYHLWFLAVAALALALWCGLGRGFGWGWRLGLGYFAATLFWITEPFLVDAAVTGWMAPFGLLAMAGGLALFWGAAFGIGFRLERRFPAWGLWAPFLVTLAEWARGFVLTGFPWANLSYIWDQTPVAQWAAVLGIYGLGAMTVLVASAPMVFKQMGRPALLGIVISGASCAMMWGVGGARLPSGPSELKDHVVRLVQPNAPQHQKWDPLWYPDFYARALEMTAAPAVQPLALILWPEMSYAPHFTPQEPPFERIAQAAQGVPVMVGFPQNQGNGQYFNAIAHIDRRGEIADIYQKFHLVPFGEYVPWRNVLEPFDVFGLAQFGGDFSSGVGAQQLEVPGIGQVQPLICYEAVFPQHILGGQERADVIFHFTNDAWFGAASGPYQHLAQARFRAIESGVPVIRVANTGVSAVIDPYGRVVQSLPLNTEGMMDVSIPAAISPPFYNRVGEALFYGVISLWGIVLLWPRSARRIGE